MKYKKMAKYILICFLIAVGVIIFIDANKLSGMTMEKVDNHDWAVKLRNEHYVLRYVPKENIAPLFGLARNEFGTKYALVRSDLPLRVQRSVAYHEIFHLQDKKNRLGTVPSEIHASLGAMLYEPLGFLQTIFLTITNADRLGYYLKF